MEQKFRQTIHLYKRFNPSKKYFSFSFNEFTWNEVSLLLFEKDEIVQIEGNYYIYSGETYNDSDSKMDSLIIFKHANRIFKVIKI